MSECKEVERKVFVCVRCEGMYADSPVSECDCSAGANEFIEGVATYSMPVPVVGLPEKATAQTE